MNEWNKLRVHRNGIAGYIELNGQRVSGQSKEGLTQLNLNRNMYLGGVKDAPERLAGTFARNSYSQTVLVLNNKPFHNQVLNYNIVSNSFPFFLLVVSPRHLP